MSENHRKIHSSDQRRRSKRFDNGHSRPKTSVPRDSQADLKSSKSITGKKLKDKEEEFRKLNAELEEKTALLVKEAEEIMRKNTATSHSENEPFISEPVSDDKLSQGADKPSTVDKRKSLRSSMPSEDLTIDIEKTVRQLEKKLEEEEMVATSLTKEQSDNIIPQVAEELSSEAMIRFLKAKLRVLQEEHEHLTAEINHKEKELSVAKTKIKEVTEKNFRLERNQQTIQVQIGKYQKLAQEAQEKCEGLQAQSVSLKRELEAQKSSQRKASTTQNAVEVRLNRALEEVDKYKTLYNRLKSDSKDSTKCDKSRIEQLESENKLLERQKTELITAFKKQMKLIDVLKRLKIHLEATRMLAFTEEEFMKALNWKS